MEVERQDIVDSYLLLVNGYKTIRHWNLRNLMLNSESKVRRKKSISNHDEWISEGK